jgi:hypothetical protein
MSLSLELEMRREGTGGVFKNDVQLRRRCLILP